MRQLAPLAVLGTFAAFLFSRTTGNLAIKLDDVYYLSQSYAGTGGYLGTMASRGYLTRSYGWLHQLLGRNTQHDHLFFFALLIVSAIIVWHILRGLLDERAALVGAMFHLGYAGRMEIVDWVSAGGYLVLLIVFLVSVKIAIVPQWNPWAKGLAITAINWPAVHLYEILMVAAPLYPALLIMEARQSGRRLKGSALAASLLPMAMFLVHWVLLYTGKPDRPIWVRHEGWMEGPHALAASIWNALWLGTSSTFGHVHAAYVLLRLQDFLYTPVSFWMLAAATATVAACILYWRTAPAAQPGDRKAYWLMAAAAFYLVVPANLITFPVVTNHFDSRLLTLPGTGVALLAALAVARVGILRPGWRRPIIAGLFAVLSLEAIAFNTVLCVDELNWSFDSGVRKQIADSGWRFHPEGGVFISMPHKHPRWGARRVGQQTWESGAGRLILLLDSGQLGNERSGFGYLWERRPPSDQVSLPVVSAGKPLLPFLVRQSDYRLVPIEHEEAR
ncbi:MAG: hypothetical protein FJW20_24630 [Acidimicrobiia bacterium]|nr:hypothetical protein [Acidimicrobiia bacterium]